MTIRTLINITTCLTALLIGSEAPAAQGRVTTESCLAKGMCAYVNTKGRVTCGPCPGQKAVLWSRTARPMLCAYTPPRGRSTREAIRCGPSQ
jgi:hypothetical protein